MNSSSLIGAALLLAGLLIGLLLGLRLARLRGAPLPAGAVDPVLAVAEVLRPASAALGRVEAELHRVERERIGSYAGLREQIAALHRSSTDLGRQTRSLSDALRHPGTRGRWGELQLQRIVELTGMLEHCDFDTQTTLPDAFDADGSLRPDMVIRLAGDRNIPVDAKVPLQSWLAATDDVDARAGSPVDPVVDDRRRRAAMAEHARAFRLHVDALARKAYWRQFHPTPEFVVMFVPGDALLDVALQVDPALTEYAFAKNVVIATPSTLFGLLRAVAVTWRSERLSESVAEVHRLGRELFHRLGVFSNHLGNLGGGLARSVDAYNAAVRSYDSRLVVTARRLGEMSGAADDDLTVPPLTTVPVGAGSVQPADGEDRERDSAASKRPADDDDFEQRLAGLGTRTTAGPADLRDRGATVDR
ncbi:DNA recombination protein RmuC [Nakamurella sp. A5-74]|uniref:DNA recombination protein RmuC n=1 Tax=Nakamurella sp. A5-74 TaxID=3158264 RepID=A0AAU8DNR4_9ACTN